VHNAISREKLRDPDLNVVEVDLSGISGYDRSDVLAKIHEMFAAERIDERLFIKVIILKFYINMLFTLLIIIFELSTMGVTKKGCTE
jgi:hypothetical protein